MKLKLYIQEAFNELVNKVTWPSWSDLQSSAIVVMIASLIIAFTVFLMDESFRSIMKMIYKMFY